MVVLKRELANKIFSTYTSSTINHIVSNTVYEDINMDALRERSAISSSNISMVSSTHSAASFILYHARMEHQSSNPTWTEQVDLPLDFQLSYTNPNEGNNSNIN